jgi:hypothetical protein
MEELIKIAANGQWILEKAKQTPAELQRQIEEFMARKKTTATNPAASVSPTMRQNSTTGLRPVQQSSGENPNWSKEQVAAFRAGLPAHVVDKANPTQKAPPTAQELQAKHAAKVTQNLDRGQAEAEAKAKTTEDRKAAWEATTKFLAQHGSKGMQALHAQMQQRKALDQAHETGKLPATVKPQLLPPQAPTVDAKGNRVMGERQGTFHGEGTTTTGKIRNKGVAYPDKETGEMKYTSTPQVEKHHWQWDHHKKKWNHIRTSLENPTIR